MDILEKSLQLPEVPRRHVGEPGEVALEGHRHGVGRAVAVLGDDEVGLPFAAGLWVAVANLVIWAAVFSVAAAVFYSRSTQRQ